MLFMQVIPFQISFPFYMAVYMYGDYGSYSKRQGRLLINRMNKPENKQCLAKFIQSNTRLPVQIYLGPEKNSIE